MPIIAIEGEETEDISATTTTESTTNTTATPAKKPCECEQHKKRMQAYNEAICSHNLDTSRIQRIVSFLMFIAVLLMLVYWIKKLFD